MREDMDVSGHFIHFTVTLHTNFATVWTPAVFGEYEHPHLAVLPQFYLTNLNQFII